MNLDCEYCKAPITGKVWEYRRHPSDPIHIFHTPECRDEYVDGYGLTPDDWIIHADERPSL